MKVTKTIFISIFDGDTERVILRTRAFEVMRQSGHKIVLLVRGADRIPHYVKEFQDDQISVELLPNANSRIETIWYYVGWNSIPTRSSEVRRVREYKNKGKYLFFVLGTVAGWLGHLRFWREFLRFVYMLSGEDYATALFKKYNPDLLFAANMFSPEDTRLLRMARKLKIKSISIAKSWDVLTTKAFTRVKADRLMVYNELNKEEAIRIGDYKQEQVTVTGFPQFDIYLDTRIIRSRKDFCEGVGLDPGKRFILYGIPGDWKSPDTRAVLSFLDKKITQGVFVKPLQVLGRFHPKYRDSSEGLDTENVVFDKPGKYFSKGAEFGIDSGTLNMNQWTFENDDIVHLANSLHHADIIVNVDSTLTLDAAANNKPVIIIAYDGDRILPYEQSIAFIYERDHYQNVIKTGGVPLVRSQQELMDTINKFLEDGNFLAEGRDRLKNRMLYKLDGRSGERVGQTVLQMIM